MLRIYANGSLQIPFRKGKAPIIRQGIIRTSSIMYMYMYIYIYIYTYK